MPRSARLPYRTAGSPFLTQVALRPERIDDPDRHPFDVRSIALGLPLRLETPVTMFVGENGVEPSHTSGRTRSRLLT